MSSYKDTDWKEPFRLINQRLTKAGVRRVVVFDLSSLD